MSERADDLDRIAAKVIAERTLRMLKQDMAEVERAIKQTETRASELMADKFEIYKAIKEAEHLLEQAEKGAD